MIRRIQQIGTTDLTSAPADLVVAQRLSYPFVYIKEKRPDQAALHLGRWNAHTDCSARQAAGPPVRSAKSHVSAGVLLPRDALPPQLAGCTMSDNVADRRLWCVGLRTTQKPSESTRARPHSRRCIAARRCGVRLKPKKPDHQNDRGEKTCDFR